MLLYIWTECSRKEVKMLFMVIIQMKKSDKTPYFCNEKYRWQSEPLMNEGKQGKGIFQ